MAPHLSFGEELLRILVAAGLAALRSVSSASSAGSRPEFGRTCWSPSARRSSRSSGPTASRTSSARARAATRSTRRGIAAQIVTGIGFLGAGAILRQGTLVRGLTTAATLWVVAAIGLAAGAGYYGGAVATTIVVLLALGPGRLLTRRFLRPYRPGDEA